MAKFSAVAGRGNGDDDGSAPSRPRSAISSRLPGNFRRPLGSVSKGTLRGRSTDDGFEIEIDLPAGAVGDEIVAANEAAGVVIRPLIDFDRSEFVDGPEGRSYTKPHLSGFHRRQH